MKPPSAPGAPHPGSRPASAEADTPASPDAPGKDLLTTAALRDRGWTDVMIRDYLGPPDATRPNPRHWRGAPMKLYRPERAEAAEADPGWAERRADADRRRAAGQAAAARKRAETEALACRLAAALVAGLRLPADPQEAAVAAYNAWHSDSCTCPGWLELGLCDQRAGAGDSPQFLRRITVADARRRLAGYHRVQRRLAQRIGDRDAGEILRGAVDAAIEARLDGCQSAVTRTAV